MGSPALKLILSKTIVGPQMDQVGPTDSIVPINLDVKSVISLDISQRKALAS